jgi:hypothetical protein
MSPGKKGSMSAEHKVALAAGRAEGRAVRLYLEALERNKPRRGRRPSSESLHRQLAEISDKLTDADPLQRLQLIQQRKTVQSRLDADERRDDLAAMEMEFVACAAAYGDRKGIDYATWREAGVPTEVLQRAGIGRSGS